MHDTCVVGQVSVSYVVQACCETFEVHRKEISMKKRCLGSLSSISAVGLLFATFAMIGCHVVDNSRPGHPTVPLKSPESLYFARHTKMRRKPEATVSEAPAAYIWTYNHERHASLHPYKNDRDETDPVHTYDYTVSTVHVITVKRGFNSPRWISSIPHPEPAGLASPMNLVPALYG